MNKEERKIKKIMLEFENGDIEDVSIESLKEYIEQQKREVIFGLFRKN